MGLGFALPSYQLPNWQPPTRSMRLTPARPNGSAAMPAAMRATTAMRRATAMWATSTSWAAAVRPTHCEVRPAAAMWATSHSATAVKCGPAVKCRAVVERGRASMERRPAMGCGRAMEPRPAVKGRFMVRRGRTAADRRRCTEPPDAAAYSLAPGAAIPRRRRRAPAGAGAGRRRQCRYPGGIEARSRARVGIGDAAAMDGVMHPRAAREGGAAAGEVPTGKHRLVTAHPHSCRSQ
jgi:hypothetical protein